MFLKVETTSDKFYAGEAIVFDVMLYTSDPNVVDVVSVSPLKLRRGDFSVLCSGVETIRESHDQ